MLNVKKLNNYVISQNFMFVISLGSKFSWKMDSCDVYFLENHFLPAGVLGMCLRGSFAKSGQINDFCWLDISKKVKQNLPFDVLFFSEHQKLYLPFFAKERGGGGENY